MEIVIVCVRMMGWGIKEEKMQELKDLSNLIKNESNGSGKVKFLQYFDTANSWTALVKEISLWAASVCMSGSLQHSPRWIQALLSDPWAHSAPVGGKHNISISVSVCKYNIRSIAIREIKICEVNETGCLSVQEIHWCQGIPSQSRDLQDLLWSRYSRPVPVVLCCPADQGDPAQRRIIRTWWQIIIWPLIRIFTFPWSFFSIFLHFLHNMIWNF